MPAQYRAGFAMQLRDGLSRQLRYVKGAADWDVVWYITTSQGVKQRVQGRVDCSSFISLAARRAAIPVEKSTVERMAKGLDGWTGRDISLEQADECDLLIWEWKSGGRHIGAVLESEETGLLEAVHAGTGHVKLSPIQGKLLTDLTKVRYLTIGD